MKTLDISTLDQQQGIVLLAQMKFHAQRLRAMLSAQEGESVQPPTLTKGGNNDLFADIATMTAHITELEHRLGDSAPAFNFQLSAASFHGGKPAPAVDNPAASSGGSSQSQSGSVPGAGKTLTEKILEARGVKTLAELNERGQRGEYSAAAD